MDAQSIGIIATAVILACGQVYLMIQTAQIKHQTNSLVEERVKSAGETERVKGVQEGKEKERANPMVSAISSDKAAMIELLKTLGDKITALEVREDKATIDKAGTLELVAKVEASEKPKT